MNCRMYINGEKIDNLKEKVALLEKKLKVMEKILEHVVNEHCPNAEFYKELTIMFSEKIRQKEIKELAKVARKKRKEAKSSDNFAAGLGHDLPWNQIFHGGTPSKSPGNPY